MMKHARDFYPTVNGGKYHADTTLTSSSAGEGTAACNSNIVIDRTAGRITLDPLNSDRPHAILCKRCVRIATAD